MLIKKGMVTRNQNYSIPFLTIPFLTIPFLTIPFLINKDNGAFTSKKLLIVNSAKILALLNNKG